MTRKDALDILKSAAWLGTDADRERVEKAIEVLEDIGEGDLIYRRDAIDALNGEITITGKSNVIAVMDLLRNIHLNLNDLPSAEPERKKCKWCESLKERHLRIEYYWVDSEGRTASFQDKEGHIVATGIANYCPNCGADMRGEQDGDVSVLH